VWQKRFNDGCRSGSLATAGGLVFLGRNDGRLTALDTRNGERVWEFMTDAPVNSAISTFEHKGRQYLVTYAGGGLFGGRKGDSVWLFGLDGTLEPVVPEQTTSAVLSMPAPGRQADLANGEAIYKAACGYCHGEQGTGGEGGGKAIQRSLRTEGIFAVMASGRNTMPSFSSSMNAEQLHDVASYLMQVVLQE